MASKSCANSSTSKFEGAPGSMCAKWSKTRIPPFNVSNSISHPYMIIQASFWTTCWCKNTSRRWQRVSWTTQIGSNEQSWSASWFSYSKPHKLDLLPSNRKEWCLIIQHISWLCWYYATRILRYQHSLHTASNILSLLDELHSDWDVLRLHPDRMWKSAAHFRTHVLFDSHLVDIPLLNVLFDDIYNQLRPPQVLRAILEDSWAQSTSDPPLLAIPRGLLSAQLVCPIVCSYSSVPPLW